MRLTSLLVGGLLLCACGGASNPPSPPPISQHEDPDDVPAVLPALPDAGASDGGQTQPDAGPPDAGPPDAGPPDAGPPDAGPSEPDGGALARPVWPELQTSLPTYALTVAPEHLAELEEHVEDRDRDVPGQFTFEGRTWQVKIRYRGRSTRFEPKKPWHVRFDKRDRFQGSTRLELLAAYAVSRLEAIMNPQRPELSLYAADGRTALDLLWLAPLAPGEAYGRQPRGAETFGPQPGP